VLSWRWPWIGAAVFIALGVAYAAVAWARGHAGADLRHASGRQARAQVVNELAHDLLLGAHDFYDDIFQSFGVPYEPALATFGRAGQSPRPPGSARPNLATWR